MTKVDVWMPWYVADYRRDTATLSFVQDSAYRRLLELAWNHGGYLPPGDCDAYCRACGAQTEEERNAVTDMIGLYFEVDDAGRVFQKRLMAEYERAHENRARQIKRTAAATAARLGRDVTNDVTRNVTNDATFTPSPSPSPSQEKTNPYTPEFEAFWASYPRKVAKEAAAKAFARVPASQLPAVTKGLKRAKQSDQWTRDGGRFIPHAATWLNGKRWLDEVDAAAPAADLGVYK